MFLRMIRIGLAITIAGLALGPLASPSSAIVLGPYPGTPITIPDSGNGSPYPASFSLGSAYGTISSMTVQINVSHQFAADIDLLLVSPQDIGVLLMSDSCGSQTISNMDLTFSDAAPSGLPADATCSTGTYKPTDHTSTTADTFPSPAPATFSSTLSAFNGFDPTGPWKLFAVDDASGDAGTINSWSLTFNLADAEIDVPYGFTSGTAEPYPSTKTYETPPGQVVSSLKLDIKGFGHESPQDVDILLADDKGNAAIVMSDACGSSPFYGYDWSFEDSNPDWLPETGDCQITDVQTTDYETSPADDWPAPAPPPSPGNFSDTFGGFTGGKWNLYVVDDSEGGRGYINSWNLELSTRSAAAAGFSETGSSAPEGAQASFLVNRDGPTPYGPGEVTFKTVAGTAKPGQDFEARSGTFSFDRNTLGMEARVPIVDDGIAEKAEDFQLELSEPKGDALLSDDTRTLTVTIPASKNATLKLGKVKLNRKKGTGTLAAAISSPGKVTIAGRGLKKTAKTMKKAGKVLLPLRARGKVRRTLKRTGKASLTAKVTYVTLGGRKVTRKRKLSMKLTRRH